MAATDVDAIGLTADQRAGFERDGLVRIPGAFTAEEAALMRDAVWRALERRGIRRDDPTTWRAEFPSHLQGLKGARPFRAVGSTRTLGAITELLGEGWERPADWGGFFLLFPTPRPWTVPHRSWHVDHPWDDPVAPLGGLKVHALFGDVEPRAGGMTVVLGSHRVVAAAVQAMQPLPDGIPPAKVRRRVMASHPYLRALARPDGDPATRIARFVDTEEEVLGVPLRVAECTGQAGDVLLLHPLLLHTRPTNAGTNPRFLLNKDLRLG